jgi:hypothetical protein
MVMSSPSTRPLTVNAASPSQRPLSRVIVAMIRLQCFSQAT